MESQKPVKPGDGAKKVIQFILEEISKNVGPFV
jgi:hypothetical protein